jgi:hypothetical protein
LQCGQFNPVSETWKMGALVFRIALDALYFDERGGACDLYEMPNLRHSSNCTSELVHFLRLMSIKLHIYNSGHSTSSNTVAQYDYFFRDDSFVRKVLDPPQLEHRRDR